MDMLINGEWIQKKECFPVLNPYTNQVIDTVPKAQKEDIERAIKSALEGFKEISSLSALCRADILKRTSELIEERGEEIARVISQEVGKTIKEARGEVKRAVQTFSLASEEAKRISGETIPFDASPSGETKIGFFIRVPIGVIAAISPFNFPFNLVAHKLAPAFAAGNAVILKPASSTPLSGLKLGQLLLEAGLPKKALNIVTGPGAEIGEMLVTDPRIRMITFTGSAEVGEGIAKRAGLKKLTMELGSNSAVIVMKDANLKEAVKKIRIGGYTLAGQVCISVQRVFVQKEIKEKFLEMLLEEVKSIKVGDPLDEDTDMGPLIDEAAAIKACEWIEEAKAMKARVLLQGERKGALLYPSILVDVPLEAKVVKLEAFSPLLVVIEFRTLDEAISMTNQSMYGLQAGIFTSDLNTAICAAKKIEVGGVMINEVPTYRADLMPYGGVKMSGIGREGPKFAIQEMTETRVVCIDLK
jgi:glyceraldehyde-3-phosphate dehydrogenase (NADP+)